MFVMKENETIDEITIIQEACNMKTLTMLDELFGTLRVHEVHLQKRDKINSKDPLAHKIGEYSQKIQDEEFESSDKSSSDSIVSEVSLISRKILKMLEGKGIKNVLFIERLNKNILSIS
ncbi:hypothetical protein CR513_47537, partial [Mucuna pruriens]